MRIGGLYFGVLLLGVLIWISGCRGGQKDPQAYLPPSIGEHDEILVLMDQKEWDGPLGDKVFGHLTGAYMVLPQYEPKFKVNHTTYDDFTALHRKFRNILVIDVATNTSPTTEYLKSLVRPGNGGAVIPTDSLQGITAMTFKNLYAKQQIIIAVLAEDTSTLYRHLNTLLDRVEKLLLSSELKKYHASAYFKGINPELTAKLKDKYGIPLDIPADYVLAMEAPGFLWLRKEEPESSSNLVIAFKDLKTGTPADLPAGENGQFQNLGITWRNILGKKYIHSSIDTAYMTTTSIISPRSRYVTVNGFPAYENRGLWEMEHDFMGGPFIQYFIYDEKRQRLILIEGFIYAPSTKKKKLLRQLEAILITFGKDNPS